MNHEHARQQTTSPDDLIARCRQGDRSAFTQLIITYQDAVLTYLSHTTDHDETARDLTIATFVAAYRGLRRYSGRMSVKAWLLALADQQRAKHRGLRRFLEFLRPGKTQPHTDRDENASEALNDVPAECGAISPQLSAYLDGELDDAAAQQVTQHLQRCDACQQEFDELVDMLDIVQTHGRQPAPPDLRVAVNAAIDASEARTAGLAAWFRLPLSQAATAFSLLLVATLSVLLLNQQHQIQQLERQFILDARRGAAPTDARPAKTTFVILTGTATVQEMLLHGSGQLSDHLTAPPDVTELLEIPGTEADIYAMLVERIRSVNGTILHDERLTDASFRLRTLTVEVPATISEAFLSVLRPLDRATTDSDGEIATTLLTILVFEKF